MGSTRCSCLLLALFLCFSVLSNSIASAHGDGINRGLSKESTRFLKGRKVGAEELEERENTGANIDDDQHGVINKREFNLMGGLSGEANVSTKNSVDISTQSAHDQYIRREKTSAKQMIKPRKQLDAVRDMFNMMNKDYQGRAHRRPPIHNDLPSDEEEP